jgi:hypothetical protein
MSRIFAAIFFALSLVPNFMMQTHPDEAITNLSVWIERLGFPSPKWLQAKNSPIIIRWTSRILTIICIGWFFWPSISRFTNSNVDARKSLWRPSPRKAIAEARRTQPIHSISTTTRDDVDLAKRKQVIKSISNFYYKGGIVQHDCEKMEEDSTLGTRAVDWQKETFEYLSGIDEFYAVRFARALPTDQDPYISIDGRQIPQSNNTLWRWVNARLKILEEMQKELRK